MGQYNEFAKLYDDLMYDVDYEKWTEYIVSILKQNTIATGNILDCACGTGEITIRLADKGYDVVGVDISADMLSIAEAKSRAKNIKIKYIRQDIANLEYNKKVNAVICACDGINYILENEDLKKFFQKSYDILLSDGILVFDISSFYKLKEILGDNTFFYEKEGVCYAWENYFDDDTNIVTMTMNFFVKKDNVHYERIEETHEQKAYKEKEIVNMLLETGYVDISVYGDFDFGEVNTDSERIFFIARKKDK